MFSSMLPSLCSPKWQNITSFSTADVLVMAAINTTELVPYKQ